MTVEQSSWGNAATDGMRHARPKNWLPRWLKISVVSLGLSASSIAGYWGILQYQGNFHEVVEGQLYRSAQPSKSELAEAAREYGIKSVLNLRGAHRGEGWYDDEVAAAKQFGMAHFDYGVSAKRVMTEQQISELLQVIRAAPKPLLIHCKSGADRTGLLSALYRYAETGATAAEADGELSLLYGHFPYLMSKSKAMDESFWAYVGRQPR